MPGFIVKQPNGRYMRFSNIISCPTSWNMTKEDYIKSCEKAARELAIDFLNKHLQPFDEVKKHFKSDNMSQKEFNKILQECEEPINDKEH